MKPWKWAVGIVALTVLSAGTYAGWLFSRAQAVIARARAFDADTKLLESTDCLAALIRDSEGEAWLDDDAASSIGAWLEGGAPPSEETRAHVARANALEVLACPARAHPRLDPYPYGSHLVAWGLVVAADVRTRLDAGDRPVARRECLAALKWAAALAAPDSADALRLAGLFAAQCSAVLEPLTQPEWGEVTALLPTTEEALGAPFSRFVLTSLWIGLSFDDAGPSKWMHQVDLARRAVRAERAFDDFVALDATPEVRDVADQRFREALDVPEWTSGSDEEPRLAPAFQRLEALRAVFTRLGANVVGK